MTDLSVIVTNWNGRSVLGDCLRSIREKTSGIEYEVILVDDASSDDSVAFVGTEFPWVTIIANGRNVGFSEANNIGMKQARGKYLILLNNDTILVNNAFAVLTRFLDEHPDVGIAGGMLVNKAGLPDISYGSFPSLSEAIHGALFLDKLFPHAGWVKTKGTIPREHIPRPFEVDYICGADIAIRREVIEEIGYLDLRFRAYCEETDYCLRLRKLNRWNIVCVPEAKIIHLFSATWGPASERKVRLLYASYEKYFTKHYSRLYGVLVRLLYAWRYFLMSAYHCLLAGISRSHRESSRVRCQEARWIVRYSLFPSPESP